MLESVDMYIINNRILIDQTQQSSTKIVLCNKNYVFADSEVLLIAIASVISSSIATM